MLNNRPNTRTRTKCGTIGETQRAQNADAANLIAIAIQLAGKGTLAIMQTVTPTESIHNFTVAVKCQYKVLLHMPPFWLTFNFIARNSVIRLGGLGWTWEWEVKNCYQSE